MGEPLDTKGVADIRRLSRNEVKTITEEFIGHGNIAYHGHKIGLAESPLCRCYFIPKKNIVRFLVLIQVYFIYFLNIQIINLYFFVNIQILTSYRHYQRKFI